MNTNKAYLNVAKIAACFMLLWALADNPYGYYQILRWVVCLVSGYSAYSAYTKSSMPWAFIFGTIAILFNPIAQIHLSRDTWTIIDIIVGIILLINIISKFLADKGVKEN